MPLKDERIQDNRIRPTPEIGCGARILPPVYRPGWDRSLRHSTDSCGRSWYHGCDVVQAQLVQEAVRALEMAGPPVSGAVCIRRSSVRTGFRVPCEATGGYWSR